MSQYGREGKKVLQGKAVDPSKDGMQMQSYKEEKEPCLTDEGNKSNAS